MRVAGDPAAAGSRGPSSAQGAQLGAGGQQAARELLDVYPRTMALFCYNDLVTVGVLQACAEPGWRVPEEVIVPEGGAVVGYADILLAALIAPALTACRATSWEHG